MPVLPRAAFGGQFGQYTINRATASAPPFSCTLTIVYRHYVVGSIIIELGKHEI
jgi:hypothetical protein